MTVSVIIDLVIVAVFVLCVVLGMKKGLFRSLADLVILVTALLLAARIASFGAELVVERFLRPATEAAIEQRIDEMMAENILATSPLEEMERVIDAIPNEFVRTQAQKVLESLALSSEATPSYSARDVLSALAGEIVDTALGTMVRNLIYSILYLIVFAVLMLLLRLVVKAMNLPFQLPVLRQLNGLGGLLFGAGKGVVLIWLGLWFLLRAQLLITPRMAEKTFLLSRLMALFEQAGFPVI